MEGAAGAAAAGAVSVVGGTAMAPTDEARVLYADPAKPGLRQVDMEIEKECSALVVTDPQIDFLSGDGVTWGVVGESVTEQGTVDNPLDPCQRFCSNFQLEKPAEARTRAPY